MSKVLSIYITYAILLVCTLTTGFVSSDDAAAPLTESITKDAFSFTIPNPAGETPLFETNDQGGRLIGIHIPIVYDGVLHFRGPGITGTKMTGNWFHGLASFVYDKTPQSDGKLHGPVKLDLLYMNVYNNGEGPKA